MAPAITESPNTVPHSPYDLLSVIIMDPPLIAFRY